MSQFSTMTTRERKMQAAAICREILEQEESEMDLGRKANVPKDIMLEELSLTSNRGSRLFKMRQKRSEKYTFESVRNNDNKQISNEAESQSSELESGDNPPPKDPSDAADAKVEPSPDSIAPGYGGPLKDVPPEKFNCTAVPKSYFSPWDQAINGDPALATSLTTCTEPEPRPNLPGYKSFNRVATPFGGFGKASKPAPVQPAQVEDLANDQDPEPQGDDAAAGRPSFNRSALGWVSSGSPVPLQVVPFEPMLIPESDDL